MIVEELFGISLMLRLDRHRRGLMGRVARILEGTKEPHRKQTTGA